MTRRSGNRPDKAGTRTEVTIHDVAREAKVSIATVSRALNGEGPVRDTTLARVRDAAKRLQYVPHSGARNLIKRETRTLGVLLPDIFGEFFSEVIRGLDHVARQRGYSLLVSCTHGESRSAEALLKAIHGRVDGLVALASDLEIQPVLEDLPRRTPVVFLNRVSGRADLDSISVDNYGGAVAMTRYLLGLGHERIAFVKGPEGNGDAGERLRGYRDALGGKVDPAVLELPGDFNEASGYRAAGRILQMSPAPTAIFAANDAMAIGALLALREHGVRIPEDVSLAGFDDVPTVRYLTPPLTSIRAPIFDLGSSAAERLLQRLDSVGPLKAVQQTLEVLLVARSSTGPPGAWRTAERALDAGKLASRAPPGKGGTYGGEH